MGVSLSLCTKDSHGYVVNKHVVKINVVIKL